MKEFKITEEQVKELAKGNSKVKKWFPEVFEINDLNKWLTPLNEYEGKALLFKTSEDVYNAGYGFNFKGDWIDKRYSINGAPKNFRLATKEEVFEALKNEAFNRGLLGSFIEMIKGNRGQISSEKTNTKPFLANGELIVGSKFGSYTLFSKGIWAKSIQTLTKEEAEKKLNVKIID